MIKQKAIYPHKANTSMKRGFPPAPTDNTPLMECEARGHPRDTHSYTPAPLYVGHIVLKGEGRKESFLYLLCTKEYFEQNVKRNCIYRTDLSSCWH